jgi:hypothetical protein
MTRKSWSIRALGVLAVAVLLSMAAIAQAPQTSQKPQAPQTPIGQVRIPEKQTNANVHMGPSSGQVILVLVPAGTVLTVVERRGEWLGVRLTPELRKLGIPMRWYKNEERGWIHQSQAEFTPAKTP